MEEEEKIFCDHCGREIKFEESYISTSEKTYCMWCWTNGQIEEEYEEE